MPRARSTKNKALPPRWRVHHGAHYYRVPPGLEQRWGGKREFLLGRSLSEAHRTWASHLERSHAALSTIGQLLDRYAIEEVPKKAHSTQRDNHRAIANLRAVFGHMLIVDFAPHHAYGYRDRRGKDHPTSANRELSVLSHAFTKAIEWGAPLQTHPMIEGKFRKLSTPPRERYVENWELLAALKLPSHRKRGSVKVLQAFMKIGLLTGRRRVEVLRLRTTDCVEDGPIFKLAKQRQTGSKNVQMNWSDALRAAIDEALASRPVDISPWVFCDKHGQSYVAETGVVKSGWDSMWQRFMDRVLAETDVAVRFTCHDLRAKTGSDAESLARAQELLQHTSAATTKRVYRRRERVNPLS